MNEREKTIRLWFDMWLNQQDMGLDDIFTEDVIYTESWSPQYNNRKTQAPRSALSAGELSAYPDDNGSFRYFFFPPQNGRTDF